MFAQEQVELRQSSPTRSTKKAGRPSTAASPTKKNGTSTKPYDGKVSQHYVVTYSLTHSEVDQEHIGTLNGEVNRERTVAESVQSDNSMLRQQLGRANERIVSLEKVREEQAQHITSLEKENHALKNENECLLDNKEVLQKEIQNASSYIVSLEEKCYTANRTSLELLQSVRDLESEVETLKAYIIDLKSRIAVYIPVKADQIDKKLAEYINNYPDRQKLKIMFMRESEGVYEFGSKRVHVKVAADKIQIKVGGGFLSIDEFLDQYTPVELEKLERRDPLKRFSERVAIQKVIGDKVGVEVSPVRRQQSPVKGGRTGTTGKKQRV